MAQLVKALIAKPDQCLLTGIHMVGKATFPKLSSDPPRAHYRSFPTATTRDVKTKFKRY